MFSATNLFAIDQRNRVTGRVESNVDSAVLVMTSNTASNGRVFVSASGAATAFSPGTALQVGNVACSLGATNPLPVPVPINVSAFLPTTSILLEAHYQEDGTTVTSNSMTLSAVIVGSI